MKIGKKTSWLLATSVALALAGCGGSGSSSSPEPVAGPADPDPVASGETVVISGKVTDAPIPNATVIVTVNGRSFQAPLPTSADGSYEVEIESDDPNALVLCEAFDPNGPARFSAVIDSFAGVAATANGADEVADVNITNVTTAQHVLAMRLTDDGSIDNVDELADVVSRVDTDDLLELSAAIKLVVENIAGTVLPSGVADTTELAEAIVDGTTTFLADVELVNPGALESAVELVLTDGSATLPFSSASVPGVYISQDNFSLFAMFEQGYGLNASYERDDVNMFDWVVNEDGTLNLWFAGPDQVAETITLLGRTGDIVNVVVRSSEGDGESNRATARYMPFGTPFDIAEIAGSYSTMDEPGELKVFLDGGTGHDLDLLTGRQSDDFTWRVDELGGLVISDLESGESSYARRLSGSEGDNLRLLVWDHDATGRLDHAAVIDVRRTDAVVDTSGGSDANTLLLAGNTYAVTEADEISLFSFRADGTFTEVRQGHSDGVWDVAERDGDWSIDANGIVTTAFPGDASADTAAIVQGLGSDFMVVETSDSDQPVLQVTRVVPMETVLVVGSFSILDETGAATESVTLSADFTGVHVGEDGVAEDFTWGVSSDGRLLIEQSGDGSFDSETMTLHLLAGSNGDQLRFVAVRRVNGALDVEVRADGGSSETLSVITLLRTG